MMKMKRLFSIACLSLLILLTVALPGCGSKGETADFEMGGKKLSYEGEKDGEFIHGKGTLYLGSKKVYEGEFVDGLIEGQGTLYVNGKVRYAGQFKDNLVFGKGIIYNSAGKKMFDGTITENVGETYKGTGTLYNELEEPVFLGDITVKGDRIDFSNRGKILYSTGAVFYNGELKDGMPSGKGIYYDPEGKILQEN
ncbi:MAG: hypothetical protein PHD60_08275 [Clostridia bacterium]|nr:hypothetical protein [Clostridia bacterium]